MKQLHVTEALNSSVFVCNAGSMTLVLHIQLCHGCLKRQGAEEERLLTASVDVGLP